MKRLTIAVVYLFVALVAVNAQTLKSLFDKYGENPQFQYVAMGPGMLNMASGLIDGNTINQEMLEKITEIKVLASFNADSVSREKLSADVDKVLKKGKFDNVLEAHEGKEEVKIYFQNNKGKDANLLFINQGQYGVNLIWMTGTFTQEDLAEMVSKQ